MHVHASALAFLTFFAMLIIAQFFQRMLVLRWPDSTIGKAVAVLN